jgi:hypothetical protein
MPRVRARHPGKGSHIRAEKETYPEKANQGAGERRLDFLRSGCGAPTAFRRFPETAKRCRLLICRNFEQKKSVNLF